MMNIKGHQYRRDCMTAMMISTTPTNLTVNMLFMKQPWCKSHAISIDQVLLMPCRIGCKLFVEGDYVVTCSQFSNFRQEIRGYQRKKNAWLSVFYSINYIMIISPILLAFRCTFTVACADCFNCGEGALQISSWCHWRPFFNRWLWKHLSILPHQNHWVILRHLCQPPQTIGRIHWWVSSSPYRKSDRRIGDAVNKGLMSDSHLPWDILFAHVMTGCCN